MNFLQVRQSLEKLVIMLMRTILEIVITEPSKNFTSKNLRKRKMKMVKSTPIITTGQKTKSVTTNDPDAIAEMTKLLEKILDFNHEKNVLGLTYAKQLVSMYDNVVKRKAIPDTNEIARERGWL